METLGIIAYTIIALITARKCASQMFYENSPRNRDWDELVGAVGMGVLIGALCGIWLPFYGIRKAFHDDPSHFARTVLGEPAEIKEYRVLEQKVGVKRATKELEQELIDL